KYTNELLKKKNVVGVGIGRKIKGGEATGELCIRVYVEKKKVKSQLKTKDLVKKEVGGIKTDVIETGKIRFQPHSFFSIAH
ncbi:unnamed protein product, partial [marine sediment metagenome]